ncbi:MAG: MBL fold metallo-hydrolase [Clostridiales bacterium]|nr:MBL fold metallo-hydrolase [Clostridiales bacterium]
MSTTILFLGTGDAMPMLRYNTCWLLEQPGASLLVDGGGGLETVKRLHSLDYDLNRIRAIFLTHGHTDHLLGAIWVLRAIGQQMQRGGYEGTLRVLAHRELCELVDTICRTALSGPVYGLFGSHILLCPVEDGETVAAAGLTLTAFDIHSVKLRQFGFRALLPGGVTVVTLGDEPFQESCRPYAEGADWLLSEAFCLYEDRERYHPYRISHATALDAGRNAASLHAKNLVLYHTRDYGADRRERFTAEAGRVFHGSIWVPEDMERIDL